MVKGLKIALALYSIRDVMEKDFRFGLEKAKEMGYDGFEFAGFLDNDPEDIRKMAEEIGLVPISAHVPLPDLVADPVGVIAAYKKVGCPYIAIPWLDEPNRPGNAGWDKTKAQIANIAEECKKQGVTLLYHNHDFEFVKDKDTGEYALDQLFREIPILETQIDTCWVKVAGEDPDAYVRKYKGRAPIVHLKDYYMSGEKPAQLYELIGVEDSGEEKSGAFEFRPLGYGVQDIPALVDASVYVGATWVVAEQDQPSMGKDSLENALMSIEFLKNKVN
jgi:sugar phosphate isomerase/epimerase